MGWLTTIVETRQSFEYCLRTQVVSHSISMKLNGAMGHNCQQGLTGAQGRERMGVGINQIAITTGPNGHGGTTDSGEREGGRIYQNDQIAVTTGGHDQGHNGEREGDQIAVNL
jgi:hypothetical protein